MLTASASVMLKPLTWTVYNNSFVEVDFFRSVMNRMRSVTTVLRFLPVNFSFSNYIYTDAWKARKMKELILPVHNTELINGESYFKVCLHWAKAKILLIFVASWRNLHSVFPIKASEEHAIFAFVQCKCTVEAHSHWMKAISKVSSLPDGLQGNSICRSHRAHLKINHHQRKFSPSAFAQCKCTIRRGWYICISFSLLQYKMSGLLWILTFEFHWFRQPHCNMGVDSFSHLKNTRVWKDDLEPL